MTSLKVADSVMPIMSRIVMKATITIAGTLRTAPVEDQPSVKSRQTFQPAPGGVVWTYGAQVNSLGKLIPTSRRKETT
jgi:hypothetical protein